MARPAWWSHTAQGAVPEPAHVGSRVDALPSARIDAAFRMPSAVAACAAASSRIPSTLARSFGHFGASRESSAGFESSAGARRADATHAGMGAPSPSALAAVALVEEGAGSALGVALREQAATTHDTTSPNTFMGAQDSASAGGKGTRRLS